MANIIPGQVLQVSSSNAEIGQTATAHARASMRRSRILADMRNAKPQSPFSGRRFKRNAAQASFTDDQEAAIVRGLLVQRIRYKTHGLALSRKKGCGQGTTKEPSITKPILPMNRRNFLHQTAAAAVATALLRRLPAAESKPPLIIDTHQHLWDLTKQKLPWLGDAPEILNHSYRTEEYRAATEGLNIRAVYMEVDIAPEQEIAEAEFVDDLARSGKNPTVAAIIGGRVASPGFGAYIRKFAGHPLIKGVRQVLHAPTTPPGYCLQDDFVRGVKLLGEQNLSFDLCHRPTDLMDGVKLAAQCQGTRFVLDHCGNPDLKCFRAPRAGEEAPKHTADEWKRAIDSLAKLPNVISKISGVTASLPKGGDASDLAPAVNHCLDAFGPDRVVFGGDWPVCLLGAPLKGWIGFLTEIIATRPAADREKLWSANAIKHYALGI
jgi:L-fuconolactonase